MRLIIPLILFVIFAVLALAFAPRSALFLLTLGLLILLDIYLIFWYYPKFDYTASKITIKRILKIREMSKDEVLNIRPGFYFPLFWMKSYKVTFRKKGKRSYFLAYISGIERQDEKIERLVRDTGNSTSRK